MTVELYCGDCLEYMRSMPDGCVDAIITDLPYGTTACEWDSIIPLDEMWKQVKRVLMAKGTFITTSSQPFTSVLIVSNLEMFKYEVIVNKVLPSGFLNAKNRPMKLHENVAVFSLGTIANGSKNLMTYNPQMWQSTSYKKTKIKDPRVGYVERGNRTPFELNPSISNGERYPVSILEYSFADRTSAVHPTQKSVKLYEYLVRTYTNPGETVLDMCMGSGTTGVACVQLGRNFIGCEIDPGYFEIAKKRIEQAELQPCLFREPDKRPRQDGLI
jgi:site-specific DNA-methyltransferase (adenine-specific)